MADLPDPLETAKWLVQVMRDVSDMFRGKVRDGSRKASADDDVQTLASAEAFRQLVKAHGVDIDAPRGQKAVAAPPTTVAKAPTLAQRRERRKQRRKR